MFHRGGAAIALSAIGASANAVDRMITSAPTSRRETSAKPFSVFMKEMYEIPAYSKQLDRLGSNVGQRAKLCAQWYRALPPKAIAELQKKADKTRIVRKPRNYRRSVYHSFAILMYKKNPYLKQVPVHRRPMVVAKLWKQGKSQLLHLMALGSKKEQNQALVTWRKGIAARQKKKIAKSGNKKKKKKLTAKGNRKKGRGKVATKKRRNLKNLRKADKTRGKKGGKSVA